jgi:hypothetical protein
LVDLELDEFLKGILAVLAYRGKTRLQLVPGVVDVALAKTMELLDKQLARERLQPTFRLSGLVPGKMHSGVKKAIRKLIDEEILQETGDTTPLMWNPHDAYLWLSATPLSLNLLERAAKIFYGQHETARIRANLHRIATRPRGDAASGAKPKGKS